MSDISNGNDSFTKFLSTDLVRVRRTNRYELMIHPWTKKLKAKFNNNCSIMFNEKSIFRVNLWAN